MGKLVRGTMRSMAAQAGTFGAIGGLFVAGNAASESVRGKKDRWNAVAGGAIAGIPIGLKSKAQIRFEDAETSRILVFV
jgi:outer membrane lipoprotein SlyB